MLGATKGRKRARPTSAGGLAEARIPVMWRWGDDVGGIGDINVNAMRGGTDERYPGVRKLLGRFWAKPD